MQRPLRLRRASLLSIALAIGAVSASVAHADDPLRTEDPRAISSPTLAHRLDDTWELARAIDTHGFHVERYVQRIEGLRVDGAHAIVRARRDGVIDLVTIETPLREGVTVPRGTPRVLEPAALLAAMGADTVGFTPVSVERVEPVLAEDPAGVEGALLFAHRVTVRGASLAERASVLLEDATLRVMRVDDLVHDARGLVYARNSASDEGMTTEVELPMQTDPATMTNAAFTVRSCIVGMRGDCTPVSRATPDMEGNFLEPPQPDSFEDGFAEVMAFHHANLLADRLETDHGFRWRCPAMGPGADDSLRIFTNFTDSPGRAYANAAFVGSDGSDCGYLLFGQSGMQDFASDADVVYHELGHAVTDQLADIVGFSLDDLGMHYDPLAVNEGTSDYWAATTQGDPHVGESLEGLDGLGRSAALRDLDGALRCPNDLFGEGHYDGRIWAGAFWDLRTELGREKIDALVFSTMTSVGAASTMTEAAETAATTADSLATMGTLTTEDAARVREMLTERGLLDCTRITPLDDTEERAAFSGLAVLTGRLGNSVAPVHYSLELPPDALRATFSIMAGTATGQYAILARGGQHVGFRGTGVQFDQRDEVARMGTINYRPGDPAFAPCSTIYFAIETTDLSRGESIFVVSGSVERSGDPGARCPEPEPDAGRPDAFTTPDAGPESPDAAMDGGMSGGGCGCRVAPRGSIPPASVLLLAGLGALLGRRRRR